MSDTPKEMKTYYLIYISVHSRIFFGNSIPFSINLFMEYSWRTHFIKGVKRRILLLSGWRRPLNVFEEMIFSSCASVSHIYVIVNHITFLHYLLILYKRFCSLQQIVKVNGSLNLMFSSNHVSF